MDSIWKSPAPAFVDPFARTEYVLSDEESALLNEGLGIPAEDIKPQPMKRILEALNAHIQAKYPLLIVAADERGNLYVTSDDDATGLKLAGLYCTGLDIHVNAIKAFSFDGILDNVERVIADEFRFEEDRQPVTFTSNISTNGNQG